MVRLPLLLCRHLAVFRSARQPPAWCYITILLTRISPWPPPFHGLILIKVEATVCSAKYTVRDQTYGHCHHLPLITKHHHTASTYNWYSGLFHTAISKRRACALFRFNRNAVTPAVMAITDMRHSGRIRTIPSVREGILFIVNPFDGQHYHKTPTTIQKGELTITPSILPSCNEQAEMNGGRKTTLQSVDIIFIRLA